MDESKASPEAAPTAVSWRRSATNKLFGPERAQELAGEVQQLRSRRVDATTWLTRTLTGQGRSDWEKIRGYKNKYRGQRCVIMGNGPSLRNTDLDRLRGEITFGLNRIYLMFDTLGWKPTFHAVVNDLVIEQCVEELHGIEAPLFSVAPNRVYLGDMPNAIFLKRREDGYTPAGPRFSKDASLGVWEGGTVTYVAMQLAYYMGFSKVILVGVDHRFAEKGPGHKVVESAGPDSNHFDPNYFGKGFKWQLPDLPLSTASYQLARSAYEADGRRLIDATVDGALTVFPKMSLAEALT